MSEVSYDLHKAKLAWMSAYGSRETKQTCMRDFLYGYTAEMVLRPTGREAVSYTHLTLPTKRIV